MANPNINDIFGSLELGNLAEVSCHDGESGKNTMVNHTNSRCILENYPWLDGGFMFFFLLLGKNPF